MALVRLATSGSVGWYKAWTLGEWSSPDPVKIFEIFSVNAAPLGEVGRAKGPFRWVNALAHRLRDNAPGKAKQNIAAHYDLGNDFYSAWLDDDDDLQFGSVLSATDALERPRSTRSTVCSTGWISTGASPPRDRVRLGNPCY